MEIALKIDLTDLRCPLPVLRTKKALSQIEVGEVLEVFCTDADAKKDIPLFVRQAGHYLVDMTESPTGTYFYIRKQ